MSKSAMVFRFDKLRPFKIPSTRPKHSFSTSGQFRPQKDVASKYLDAIRLVPLPNGLTRLQFHKDDNTPSVSKLGLEFSPSRPIAELVLAEWKQPKSHSLTSILLRANEFLRNPGLVEPALSEITKYLPTDSIRFIDPAWDSKDPVIQKIALLIEKISEKKGFSNIGLSYNLQPPESSADDVTKAKLILESLNSFELAAFEHLTRSTKSFLVPLALYDDIISCEDAAELACVELMTQANRWGMIKEHHQYLFSVQLVAAGLCKLFFSLRI